MIVETLRASQSRIETLLGRAAMVADASQVDAAAASKYVARGLAIAVALRVCDHADSVVPRLRGRRPVLDAAVARLFEDHRRSLELVRQLSASVEWEQPVLSLGYVFVRSFAIEEELLFPAISVHLSGDEQRAVEREMRMRRSRRIAATPARHVSGSIGDRDGVLEHP